MNDTILQNAKDAFLTESEQIKLNADLALSEEFKKAVEILSNAAITGMSGCGHSGIACMHFAHLMCCIDKPAKFIPPSEAVHGGMGFMSGGGAFVLVSRGGKTAELIPIMQIAKAKGCKIICLTENDKSPLALGSDVILKLKIIKECDKYNSQGTASFAVTCAVFDALQTAVLENTGFEVESFALNHPGGAVGERLNEKPLEF